MKTKHTGTHAWRRALFFSLTFASAGFASFLMLDILVANGFSLLELAGLALFFCLFIWIAGAFWTAIAGFIVHVFGPDPAVLHANEGEGHALRGRTALVMPVYNEDPDRVFAGIHAMWSSLANESEQAHFDFFVLSDTRRPEIAVAEEAAWRALIARHNAQGRIFYRRREENVGRKAGNIADFVRRWGGAYDYMLVLDADSVMSGKALVTLARLMDLHPRAGIIQTLPLPAGRTTLFARLIQFAARLNGPMLAYGLTFWQRGESNYWGHNAILRMRAFASHCALPQLPGEAPLGGEILSHDFVEAAFMRRAGYEVWMVADLEGSWEEVPSNIVDFAARDRRWTQGNLQHLKVLPAQGLHWLSRMHMVTGIVGYVTSPIWMTVLILSSIVTCLEAIRGHAYFLPGTYTLFPDWPESRAGEIASLLVVTIVVLLLPKVLGAALALANPVRRRGFGGGPRLLASLLLEQIFSMLLAPAMMLFHSSFVLQTLAGIRVQWNAQERGDRGIGFREAFVRHKWHLAIGVLWGALILLFAPAYMWWMLPVLAGLILSTPLTVWTSKKSVGLAARRLGLFVTPEETATPPELAAIESSATDAPVARLHDDENIQWVPVPCELKMEAAPLAYVSVGDTIRRLRGAPRRVELVGRVGIEPTTN